MSKIAIQNIKIFIVSAISIIVLFLVMMFLQNKNTMIITMNTITNTPLQVQIYFTGGGEPFSEDKSRKAFKVKGNQHYFSLPELSEIQYARLDPARREVDIAINKIIITQSKWFKTSISELPVENLKPLNQVENYKKSAKSIKFSTTGHDPQLDVVFSLKHISTATNMHMSLFLVFILIFTVFLYLYKIYKTTELNSLLTSKLILYSLFFALTLFKVDYYKEHVKFAYPPDELAHLSYINYVNTHDETIPKFEESRMLNNKSAGNYLSHPPLYYNIMGMVFDENYSIVKNVDNFRTLSMIIFIASFLLLLYLGFSSSISLLSHFVYLTFISSIPMYAYLGGSITNDNLAMLGAMIFIIGLKKILEKQYTNLTYFILGIGIFIAYFSKLTAAILIFFAIIFFLVYAVASKSGFKINKIQITMLILFLLPIMYYQLYIMLSYHSLLPSFNVTYPEQYLNSGFFVPEEYRAHLTRLEWFERMKHYIIEGWFGIHSHHSLIKSSVFEYLGLLILHIFALFALFFKCKDDSNSYCIIGKLGLLSLFSVLLVQYMFSYKTHLSSGYMGGLQPRYLLPFMFSFAIMSSIFVERFKHIFLFNIFIILICIHAIYSDFFYFLQYYQ